MKKMMFVVVVMVGTLFAGAKEQKADELLQALNMEETLNKTIVLALDGQIAQNTALLPYREIMLSFMRKYLSYESLKDEFVTIYVDAFSIDEMNDLIKFYGSKTGKKAIRLVPELSTKGSMIGQKRMEDHMDELQAAIEQAAMGQ